MNKVSRKVMLMIISFYVVSFLLSGCQRVSYKEDIATMTEVEKLEDFEYVLKTLDELYPYWGELKDKGIDKERLEETYRLKLGETKNTVEFLNEMQNYFDELGGDYGHLSSISPGAYKYFAEVYEGLEPWDEVLNNATTKAMYKAMYPYSKSFGLLSDNNQSKKANNSNRSAERKWTSIINDGKTMYVVCPSFNGQYVEEDSVKIIDFINTNSHLESLVIDLRGNGGGSDNYWIKSFVKPIITVDHSYSMYYLYKDSLLNNKDADKFIRNKGLDKKQDSVGQLIEFSSPSNYIKEFDYFYLFVNTIEAESSTSIYEGEIFVLMDAANSSASADFTGFCKETGFATLVGESSSGDQCFGDPSLFVLPNSGLIFRFDLFYGLNYDGSSNGVKGVVPDITCFSEEALDKALLEINSD